MVLITLVLNIGIALTKYSGIKRWYCYIYGTEQSGIKHQYNTNSTLVLNATTERWY